MDVASHLKIGPNDPCPCWTGKKYKKCCRGRIDWTAIFRSGEDQTPHFSIRGRNLLFAEAIAAALQMDNLDALPSLADFKKAFTADAVRKIYEAVYDLWPPDTDIQSLLERSSEDVSGLYIGDYQKEFLKRAIVRHSLYANRILLVDSFVHPYITSDKYNPLIDPHLHRAQTLKNVNVFLDLLPWIEAGIVEVIRTPSDFDRDLNWDAMKRAGSLRSDPAFEAAAADSVQQLKGRHFDNFALQQSVLSAPDRVLVRKFREGNWAAKGITEAGFIDHINKLREADPDFLEPLSGGPGHGQLHIMTSGGTYEVARLTAQMSKSYLFTDLPVKWHLIERDRQGLPTESKVWSPFAKAVQNTKLHYLNNLETRHALQLRQEGKLEGVRSVLMEAWSKERSEDPFNEEGAIHLASNLSDAVREAEAEWVDIKAEITKFGASGIGAGMLAAGPLVASGHALWLAGAAATGAVSISLFSKYKERAFQKRYPAAFFMSLSDE